MRGAVQRRAFRQIHQSVEARSAAAQARQGAAHDPAHDEGAVRLAGHTMGDVGDRTVFEVGEEVAPPGRNDALQGLVRQFLIVAHQIMDRLAHVLALGHGDLLDGVLKLDARGFQPFGQVGAVQQLEGGDAVAPQPVLQHPADHLAGMRGVEVLRRRAARSGLILGHDPLALELGSPARQHGHAVEFHGVRVERLLGHAHGGGAVVGEHVLGGLDGLGAVLRRHLEAPGGWRGLANVDFVVDWASHGTLVFCTPSMAPRV